ncbi:hypothetical protein M569_10632, partial [Genlisea aurea]
CFVFLPAHQGLASDEMLLQTSIGGFLIQAKGIGIEKGPPSDLDRSSGERWRNNFSLFNPFEETLHLKEVTAWISTSSGRHLNASTSICHVRHENDFGFLTNADWPTVERVESGWFYDSWEVSPHNSESVIGLDISFKSKAFISFRIKFLKPSNDEMNSLTVPLELDLSPDSAYEIPHIQPAAPDHYDTFLRDSIQPQKEIEVMSSHLFFFLRRFFSFHLSTYDGQVSELVLRNWKSHATVGFMSVLNETELLFPSVFVGSISSKWITVSNPSQEQVVVQLFLNSGEVLYNCGRAETLLLQPSSASSLKEIATARPGFSMASNALTEAVLQPFSHATLGPILFHPSEECEWRSAALVRNNLSVVERISLRGIGCSRSLVMLEGDNPVDSLYFRVNLPSQIDISSLYALNRIGIKALICSQAVNKEVEIKNVGDVSLEVKRITVSGKDCNLDGFRVVNCSGFSLRPGESIAFRVSYLPDFSAATVQRELELDFTSGVGSIHMKADVPLCLINFCKGSAFWIRVKQAIIMLSLSALLLSAMILVLFPQTTTSASDAAGAFFAHMECLHKSVAPEHKTELESRIDSPLISSPSSVENLDIIHERLESDLRIRVKTEKGRRRRRKRKSFSPGVLNHELLSSSQSGNSTPSSSSLSPVAFLASRRPLLASPPPSYDSSPQQCDEKNTLDDDGFGKSVLQPSAAFDFPCRAAPSFWAGKSPILTSTSKLPLHARAPGTKIRNEGDETRVGEFDEKYTYDMWGDRVFSFEVSRRHSPQNVDNNRESFFYEEPFSSLSNSNL